MNDLLNRVLGLVIFCIVSPIILTIFVISTIFQGWPVFFWQRRAGIHKKAFWMVKFRTMRNGADEEKKSLARFNEADGPVFKIKNDPRFTMIGKFLSTTGLDELPQLINVIRGEMALVGPRPLPIDEARKIEKRYASRFEVIPGLTSSWVVEGTHRVTFKKWMQLDLEYVDHKSFVLDIKIMFQTALGLIARTLKSIGSLLGNYKIQAISGLIFVTWYFLIDKYVKYPLWQDWDEAMAFFATGANAIRSGSIPLWDKYMCGGQVGLAHPLSPFMSPLITLMFLGVPLGARLWIFAYMMFGYIGMYKLLSSYLINRFVCLIGSVVYVFSGLFTSAVWGGGMLALLPFILMPLLILALNQSYLLPWPKYIVSSLLAGMVIAAMCISGLHYLFLPILYVVVDGILRLQYSPQKRLIVIVTCILGFIGFSAPKLLPELFAANMYPRPVADDSSGIGVFTMVRLMIDPTQRQISFRNWYPTTVFPPFFTGHTPNLEENGTYVGILTFMIFVYGLILMVKQKSWRVLALLFIFGWLSLGSVVSPSIYTLWRNLPLASWLRESGRFRYLWFPLFVLIFAQGLNYLMLTVKNRSKASVIAALLLTIVLDLFFVNIKVILSFGSQRVGDNPRQSGTFQYVCPKNVPPTTLMYEYMAAGYGIGATCHRSLPVPLATDCSSEYNKGEMYKIIGVGRVERIEFLTNSIRIEGELHDKDKITINMNYAPGWYVVYKNQDGWKFDKSLNNVGTISYKIESQSLVNRVIFIYFPPFFGYGAAVFVTTLSLYLWLRNKVSKKYEN